MGRGEKQFFRQNRSRDRQKICFLQKKSESGVALVIVIGLVLSLSLMVWGLVVFLQTDQRDLSVFTEEEKAFFAAEGGVEKTLYYLNQGKSVHQKREKLGDIQLTLDAVSPAPGYAPITVVAQGHQVRARVTCLAEDELLTPDYDFVCQAGSYRRRVVRK